MFFGCSDIIFETQSMEELTVILKGLIDADLYFQRRFWLPELNDEIYALMLRFKHLGIIEHISPYDHIAEKHMIEMNGHSRLKEWYPSLVRHNVIIIVVWDKYYDSANMRALHDIS